MTRWEPRIDGLNVTVVEVPLNRDLDATSVISRATGERVAGSGFDIDIEFVERATTERDRLLPVPADHGTDPGRASRAAGSRPA